MDKNEFLDILRSQLSGQMPEGQINTHIQYYRNYIEERMQSCLLYTSPSPRDCS